MQTLNPKPLAGEVHGRCHTVLSAEPVASTNSLKGLKPRQLTSAACASTACPTAVCRRGTHMRHDRDEAAL